jgi:hypothetical protein
VSAMLTLEPAKKDRINRDYNWSRDIWKNYRGKNER